MVGFHELFVNFEATSLVRSAYQFDEIRLTLPHGLLRIQPTANSISWAQRRRSRIKPRLRRLLS
ncbi:MAG: hypothetical protein U0361_05105 [Nitrospiraceae bacterium]